MHFDMNEKSEAETHAMEEGSNDVAKNTNTRPSALFQRHRRRVMWIQLGEAFFCFSQIRQPHTRDQRPKKKSSRAQS